MTAVLSLEVDELAAVVPDLDNPHRVVLRGSQVINLRHDWN